MGFDKEIVNKSFSNAIKLNWLGKELFADVLLLFSFFAFFFGEFGAFGGDFVLNFFWVYKKITIWLRSNCNCAKNAVQATYGLQRLRPF